MAKYLSDFASAIGSSFSNIGVLQVVLVLSISIFFLPIFKPVFAHFVASCVVLSCICDNKPDRQQNQGRPIVPREGHFFYL